jgi:hypothetical protein
VSQIECEFVKEAPFIWRVSTYQTPQSTVLNHVLVRPQRLNHYRRYYCTPQAVACSSQFLPCDALEKAMLGKHKPDFGLRTPHRLMHRLSTAQCNCLRSALIRHAPRNSRSTRFITLGGKSRPNPKLLNIEFKAPKSRGAKSDHVTSQARQPHQTGISKPRTGVPQIKRRRHIVLGGFRHGSPSQPVAKVRIGAVRQKQRRAASILDHPG